MPLSPGHVVFSSLPDSMNAQRAPRMRHQPSCQRSATARPLPQWQLRLSLSLRLRLPVAAAAAEKKRGKRGKTFCARSQAHAEEVWPGHFQPRCACLRVPLSSLLVLISWGLCAARVKVAVFSLCGRVVARQPLSAGAVEKFWHICPLALRRSYNEVPRGDGRRGLGSWQGHFNLLDGGAAENARLKVHKVRGAPVSLSRALALALSLSLSLPPRARPARM